MSALYEMSMDKVRKSLIMPRRSVSKHRHSSPNLHGQSIASDFSALDVSMPKIKYGSRIGTFATGISFLRFWTFWQAGSMIPHVPFPLLFPVTPLGLFSNSLMRR